MLEDSGAHTHLSFSFSFSYSIFSSLQLPDIHISVARQSPLTNSRAVVSPVERLDLLAVCRGIKESWFHAVHLDIAANTADVSSLFVRPHGVYKSHSLIALSHLIARSHRIVSSHGLIA